MNQHRDYRVYKEFYYGYYYSKALNVTQLSAEQEIARLKKLLRERDAEIDFLKKATAYFAKVP